jgi:hypothetical protein
VFCAGAWLNVGNIRDGSSNTVFFLEHLALCRNPAGGNNATDGSDCGGCQRGDRPRSPAP